MTVGPALRSPLLTDSATATEVQKNFRAWHDRALAGPVRVTKHGRETVFIVSASFFHAMKQKQRQALFAAELTDEEAALVASARSPAEHQYSLKEVD